MNKKWKFWVDRGGTFTDIIAIDPSGNSHPYKLLSDNPEQYDDAAIAAIRYFLKVEPGDLIPSLQISTLKIGTTVTTNALLENKGEKVALITSTGFKDILKIADQTRPNLFSLDIAPRNTLYEHAYEVPERIDNKGVDLEPFDCHKAAKVLENIYLAGYRSLAIVFMHSYQYPEHERKLKKIAKDIGFTTIACSSEISSLIKIIPRGNTATLDAYLGTILARYVQKLQQALPFTEVQFMQSNGGLIDSEKLQVKNSILSGPAGGLVAAQKTAMAMSEPKILTFDMGGTSTDVAHCAGELSLKHENMINHIKIYAPMLDVHTIAAGGGSILSFQQGRFQVGPESAGASPGPCSYGKNGPLTVTDANVLLGRIQADFFPKVFGPKADLPLDTKAVSGKFCELTHSINQRSGIHKSQEAVAQGFLEIAVNNMVSAIKKISIQQGHDIDGYALSCLGSASGLHACDIAEALNLKTILFHRFSGLLSAYGMGLAQTKQVETVTIEDKLDDCVAELNKVFKGLITKFAGESDNPSQQVKKWVHLKYKSSSMVFDIPFILDAKAMKAEFTERFKATYGYLYDETVIVVERISVEWILDNVAPLVDEIVNEKADKAVLPVARVETYIDNEFQNIPIFNLKDIQFDSEVLGPALIVSETITLFLKPYWRALVSDKGNLILKHAMHFATRMENKAEAGQKVDPVTLELFNNIFMLVAEEMGEVLTQTAISINIKERQDFSCAIFNNQGNLVANAPHQPVHLGSMGHSVKVLLNSVKKLKEGDAYIINNPYNGGTHLPDLTIISPVFMERNLEFFVASRGHHADIGGITPGSMPAYSHHILEEGVVFDVFKIVSEGAFFKKELMQKFSKSEYPPRNQKQNIMDIEAQLAANKRGIIALEQIVLAHGISKVRQYMAFIQENATQAVINLIPKLKSGQSTIEMDNGIVIAVDVDINQEQKTATIDFSRSSKRGKHNFHAPKAVTTAAVLYVFRAMVKENIPLNDGCLVPLKIIIPDDSVLNPKYPSAVVAGNVETSQVIVNALFEAMGVCAHAQGTMNNLILGNKDYQYYETISGGMGASNIANGADAIQTHMTNSKLTDPEVLEMNYPVILRNSSIRVNSGGIGKFQGGNGVIREIEAQTQLNVNILSNNRKHRPKGIQGGGDAKMGRNYIVRKKGGIVRLSATDASTLEIGDKIVVETPGGGGYGLA